MTMMRSRIRNTIKRSAFYLIQKAYNQLLKINRQNCRVIVLNVRSNDYKNLKELISFWRRKEDLIVIRPNDCLLVKLAKISKGRVIFIEENDNVLSNIRLSSRQTVIHCWHGGGLFKKIAYDSNGLNSSDQQRLKRIYQNVSYILISDQKFLPVFSSAFKKPKQQILPFGLIRTDKLFEIDVNKSRKLLESRYPQIIGKKIILYAPTYREQENNRKLFFPDLKLDKDDFILAARLHPSLKSHICAEYLDFSCEDLYELLPAVDVLITDYSSILFDFSFFNRPIIIYAPDIEKYERGLYIDVNSVFKGSVATSIEELKLIIDGVLPNNKIWRDFMGACDGHVKEKIDAFTESLLKENQK